MKHFLRICATLLLCNTAFAQKILPRVQFIKETSEKVQLDKNKFEIIASEKPVKSFKLAEEFLLEKLDKFSTTAEATPVKLYLALAGDPIFANTSLASLKLDKAQEYVVRFHKVGDSLNIYAAASDNRGLFYSAATLCELIDDSGLLSLHEIHDYPHWELRYTGGYNPISLQSMKQLARFKINGYGIQHRYDWKRFKAEEYPKYAQKANYRDWFEEISSFRSNYGDLIDFMMMINLYCGEKFDVSKPEDMLLLKEQCLFAANYVQEIMLQFDDFTPQENSQYTFVSEAEKEKFADPGQVHGYITRQIYETLQEKFPKVRLSVCPAPYSLNSHNAKSPSNRKYLQALANELPDSVRVVWTGPAVESQRINKADYLEYQKLVVGKKLFLWDNSSNMISTPMEEWNSVLFSEMAAMDKQIYINGHGFSFSWSWIFAINSNDYLWNPNAFNPEQAYALAFEKTRGKKIPDYVLQTKKDLVQMKNTWDRDEKAELAKKILERKENFLEDRLSFMRIENLAKAAYAQRSSNVKNGTVHRLLKAPELSANINDASWANVNELDFTAEKFNSTVKLAYTSEALYIRFVGYYEKAPEKITRLPHDSNLKESSDVFHIGLQAPLRNQRAAWISIDINGNRHDYKEWQAPDKFDPDIKQLLKCFDEYWIVDMKIPFSELAGHIMYSFPTKDVKWNFNFARRNNLSNEFSSWAPAPKNNLMGKQYFGSFTFE